jgi:hypothetical protein
MAPIFYLTAEHPITVTAVHLTGSSVLLLSAIGWRFFAKSIFRLEKRPTPSWSALLAAYILIATFEVRYFNLDNAYFGLFVASLCLSYASAKRDCWRIGCCGYRKASFLAKGLPISLQLFEMIIAITIAILPLAAWLAGFSVQGGALILLIYASRAFAYYGRYGHRLEILTALLTGLILAALYSAL